MNLNLKLWHTCSTPLPSSNLLNDSSNGIYDTIRTAMSVKLHMWLRLKNVMQGWQTRNKIMLNMRSPNLSSIQNLSAFTTFDPPRNEICCSKVDRIEKNFTDFEADFRNIAISRLSGKDSSKSGKRKTVRECEMALSTLAPSSLTGRALGVCAGIGAAAFLGYCIYFDHSRRYDECDRRFHSLTKWHR